MQQQQQQLNAAADAATTAVAVSDVEVSKNTCGHGVG